MLETKQRRNRRVSVRFVFGRFIARKRHRNIGEPRSNVSLRPLEGFVIGVTADRRAAEQSELLERRGASVVHAPTISTEYLGSDDELRRATEAVIARPPDYLVATTGIGVRAWFEAAQAWGLGEDLVAALATTRVLARGPKASAAAQVAGLEVWASPPNERLDELVTLLGVEPLVDRVVAFQHYGNRDDEAVAVLAARGAAVVEVPVYRYGQPVDDARARGLVAAVCEGQVDAVTFTSAPAVRNLLAVARHRDREQDLLVAFNENGVVAACIGPVCAEAARGSGIAAPVAPNRGRLGLLVRVLADALGPRRRELRCASLPLVVQGRAVAVDGDKIDLPPRERAVLDVLLERRGAVVSKAALLHQLGSSPDGTHALVATVARLRRRLGPAGTAIHAVRGRGYRLDVRMEGDRASVSP